jgi:hypothetical protein
LGDTPQSRAQAYLESSRRPLELEMLAEIREAIRRGLPVGSEAFKDRIESEIGQRVRLRKPGRKPRR